MYTAVTSGRQEICDLSQAGRHAKSFQIANSHHRPRMHEVGLNMSYVCMAIVPAIPITHPLVA